MPWSAPRPSRSRPGAARARRSRSTTGPTGDEDDDDDVGRPPDARAEGAADRTRHRGLRDARRGRDRAAALAVAGPTRRRPPSGHAWRRWPPRRSPSSRSPPRGSASSGMHDAFGLTAREMLTCGCHVHVSVEDDEEGVAVLNRIRVWLPVLTALSANSPFWQGTDSGYASFRSQAWQRWPSAGPTELFADARRLPPAGRRRPRDRHRARRRDGLLRRPAVGEVADRRGPHRRRAAAGRGRRHPRRPRPRAGRDRGAGGARRPPGARRPQRGAPRWPRWRAGRSGLGRRAASHPGTGRPAPAADVVGALLEHVRPGPDRRRATSSGSTDGVAELLRRGTGADLQRRVHRETGDLAAVVRAAVAVTAGEPTRPPRRRPAARARFRAMYTASWRDVVRRDLFGPSPDPARPALPVRHPAWRWSSSGCSASASTSAAPSTCRPPAARSSAATTSASSTSPSSGLGALPQHRLVRFMAKSVGLRPLVRRPVHARHAAHPGRPARPAPRRSSPPSAP